MSLVVIEASELASLIRREIRQALGIRDLERTEDVRPLSGNQVAKLAKRRRAAVQAAITAGTLRARNEKGGHRIAMADAQAWIAAGCPTAA